MTVRELTSCCYDTIVIYTSCDDKFYPHLLEFKDLYKGDKENIPNDLLDLTVHTYGAKRKGVIDICVKSL